MIRLHPLRIDDSIAQNRTTQCHNSSEIEEFDWDTLDLEIVSPPNLYESWTTCVFLPGYDNPIITRLDTGAEAVAISVGFSEFLLEKQFHRLGQTSKPPDI